MVYLHVSVPTTICVFSLGSSIGYLSDEPDELMVALLSYACALAETGISPINVLMTYLPNLFGPGDS